jgi:hypothetical protein
LPEVQGPDPFQGRGIRDKAHVRGYDCPGCETIMMKFPFVIVGLCLSAVLGLIIGYDHPPEIGLAAFAGCFFAFLIIVVPEEQ